jgi:hypothetical protein
MLTWKAHQIKLLSYTIQNSRHQQQTYTPLE